MRGLIARLAPLFWGKRGTCKTCQHWNKMGRGKTGDCHLVVGVLSTEVVPSSCFAVYGVDRTMWGLRTGPHFGCVNHTKPKKDMGVAA